MANKETEKFDIKENYGHDCILSKDEFISKNNINIEGLSDEGSIQNIYKYGKNEIKQSKPKRWYNYFLASLLSPFNIILLGISGILFYTDVILAEVPNYTNIIVIIII